MHTANVAASGFREQMPLDLTAQFNNRGLTALGEPGGFNIWSNTFPAEELPPIGSTVRVGGVGFAFPGSGDGGDNVRCRGQRVDVPAGRYEWLYLLGAAERRTEDEVELDFADGRTRRQWLRLSDFWPETPAFFGEVLAFRTEALGYPRHIQRPHAPTIWQQRIPVGGDADLIGVRLPDNPAIHVFSMTGVASAA